MTDARLPAPALTPVARLESSHTSQFEWQFSSYFNDRIISKFLMHEKTVHIAATVVHEWKIDWLIDYRHCTLQYY